MGIYDRDYSRGDYQPSGARPQMQLRFPKITPVVKWLLITNICVFFACGGNWNNNEPFYSPVCCVLGLKYITSLSVTKKSTG